ncbi:MAG: GNAT family N-acetyltransferase [Streptococcaceae bacterium]|jgi:RimJ/RimL family protein N-acetyltransferase|nr:GNAT family N-acetyltransferase [Streptococcaceae bacterium]
MEIDIREAVPEDAANLLEALDIIRKESDFLTMDETDTEISEQWQAAHLANLYESSNNVLLLALDGEKIVGTASIHADQHRRISHIGDIGISILKAYQGVGIGRVLFSELVQWAKESGRIFRLQLTVQKRNTKAIQLYKQNGFTVEAEMERGAIDADGNFLTVYMMSKMID